MQQQWRIQEFATGVCKVVLPLPSLPFPSPSPSFPLEVSPLNTARRSGGALKLPQRDLGRSPMFIKITNVKNIKNVCRRDFYKKIIYVYKRSLHMLMLVLRIEVRTVLLRYSTSIDQCTGWAKK